MNSEQIQDAKNTKESTLINEGHIALMSTTLKRIDSYLTKFDKQLEELKSYSSANNEILKGSSTSVGIVTRLDGLDSVDKLQDVIIDKIDKRVKILESKDEKIAKYEKWLKRSLWPNAILLLTNIGIFLWKIVTFALEHGFIGH